MNRFIIIVPVYNAIHYIEKCLTSITSQRYTNYELCVMDDCSTDGTWQKIGEICNRGWQHFNMCRNDYRIASPLANIVKAVELFALDIPSSRYVSQPVILTNSTKNSVYSLL